MKAKALPVAIAMTTALSASLLVVSSFDNQAQAQETFRWKMVTSWPKNFPGVGQGPERLSQLVEEMSDGRLTIEVFGAGQQTAPLSWATPPPITGRVKRQRPSSLPPYRSV